MISDEKKGEQKSTEECKVTPSGKVSVKWPTSTERKKNSNKIERRQAVKKQTQRSTAEKFNDEKQR